MEMNYGTLRRIPVLLLLLLLTVPLEAQQKASSAVRVGIMLPLHNDSGDGRRMTEYYRGVLMACDSLRADGISTDIRAWNVAEDTDINAILQDPDAADRDLIIGPSTPG